MLKPLGKNILLKKHTQPSVSGILLPDNVTLDNMQWQVIGVGHE